MSARKGKEGGEGTYSSMYSRIMSGSSEGSTEPWRESLLRNRQSGIGKGENSRQVFQHCFTLLEGKRSGDGSDVRHVA